MFELRVSTGCIYAYAGLLSCVLRWFMKCLFLSWSFHVGSDSPPAVPKRRKSNAGSAVSSANEDTSSDVKAAARDGAAKPEGACVCVRACYIMLLLILLHH